MSLVDTKTAILDLLDEPKPVAELIRQAEREHGNLARLAYWRLLDERVIHRSTNGMVSKR